MSSPLLSIAIVSYNTRELLRRCLASVAESPHHAIYQPSSTADDDSGSPLLTLPCSRDIPMAPLCCELIVVDNASQDGSADMVAAEFPKVKLIRSATNLGFARATNAGLQASRGDLLLLLNPDTEVLGSALPDMASFITTKPDAAAVGPALVYPDGGRQHAAFQFPTLLMSFFDFFPLNHRLIDSRLNGRYRDPEGGEFFAVDHPLGAAMMIRRDALNDVGMLDEGFFMYCEEVDWCLRAKRRGWQIYQLPGAKVVHHVAQSSRQFREEMLIQLHRSRYRLFAKHYSAGFVSAHRAITRLGLAREMARTWWENRRGRMTVQEKGRRLRAYRTIWGM